MRDEKRIEWVASDGGGWKALRLYTGECVRVCAERVTVASGTRRPLYALSEVVRAIECSDSAHKGKLQTWNAQWGRSCPENVRRCVYELPKQGRHGTKTKTVDFGGVEALVEAIDPDRLQDFNHTKFSGDAGTHTKLILCTTSASRRRASLSSRSSSFSPFCNRAFPSVLAIANTAPRV